MTKLERGSKEGGGAVSSTAASADAYQFCVGAMLLSLYIVNKSGGLIYHRDFSSLAKLDTNDTLRLGSIW